MEQIIVIGISAAGISAISKIRQLNKEVKITAITYETDLPYNKCLLADYLSQTRSETEIYTRNRAFFESNNINLLLGKKVERVLPDKNSIVLDSGEIMQYDKLLIATGVQQTIPSFAQVSASNLFLFNTSSDAKSLNNYITSKNVQKAVVIGAGLTGVEVVDSLLKRGIDVSLVEYHPRPLFRQLDNHGSEYILKLMHACGAELFLNSIVKEFRLDDKRQCVSKVILSYNLELDVDLVVLATGAKIDHDFFVNAGIEISDSGVVVDEYLQTNYSNIYAAGDICRIKDTLSGEYVQSSTWPDAVMQGMIAGCNIAGQQKSYPGISNGAFIINNSNFFGKDFFSSGSFGGNFSKYYPNSIILKCDQNLVKIFLDAQNIIRAFYIIGEPSKLSKIKMQVMLSSPISNELIANLGINIQMF